MTSNIWYKISKSYTLTVVFIPFTLLTMVLFVLNIIIYFTENPLVYNSLYQYYTILGLVISILIGYIITYTNLSKYLEQKKSGWLTVSILLFLLQLWTSITSMTQLTTSSFPERTVYLYALTMINIFVHSLVTRTGSVPISVIIPAFIGSILSLSLSGFGLDRGWQFTKTIIDLSKQQNFFTSLTLISLISLIIYLFSTVDQLIKQLIKK
jgi:hypothetical protein